MTYTEYLVNHPEWFYESLLEMNRKKIAELMDSGDKLELGRYIEHQFSIDKSVMEEEIESRRPENTLSFQQALDKELRK